MADLSEIQSAGTTKIIGSDITGLETYPVDATVNGLKVDGSSITQPISAASLPLPDGAATAANQATEISSLQVLDNAVGPVAPGTAGTGSFLIGGVYNTTPPALTNTQQVALQVDSQGRLITAPQTQAASSGLIVGTQDGTVNGTQYVFVNNRKEQILRAVDREMDIEYADFGTKNQRVTKITYTASSIGTGAGFIAEKRLTYTLVGTKYRRDSINWVLT